MDQAWLERLQQRRSAPRVEPPAPSDKELDALFAAALSAPDHGALKPTRFLVIKEAGLTRFADACVAEVLADRPQATEAELNTARRKALRAPMVIVASCEPMQHPKVPEVEQLASSACAVQLLQLAIDALGYGSVWRTGPWAYSPRIKSALGLAESAAIVAFLYVGTATTERPARERVCESDYWQFY
jgi:nitroreductase